MSTPHKCPVCEGSGQIQIAPVTTDAGTRACHACDGKGIVWSPDVTWEREAPWVAPSVPPYFGPCTMFPPVNT